MDAVQAGQNNAQGNTLGSLIKSYALPLLMYYMIFKPWFSAKEEKDPDEPLPEPESWAWTLTRWCLYLSILGLAFLLMIYVQQEGMLYAPSVPIQFIEQNPPPFKSPAARNMQYEELWIVTEDNLRL